MILLLDFDKLSTGLKENLADSFLSCEIFSSTCRGGIKNYSFSLQFDIYSSDRKVLYLAQFRESHARKALLALSYRFSPFLAYLLIIELSGSQILACGVVSQEVSFLHFKRRPITKFLRLNSPKAS